MPTINKAALSAAWNIVSPLAAKAKHEICRNVRLAPGTAGRFELRATDIEVEAVATGDSGLDDLQPILLPEKRFSAILREAPGDDIGIEVRGANIVVTAKRAKWELPTAPEQEFPEMKSAKLDSHHAIEADVLRYLIDATGYCMDLESTRYALGGIYFEFEGKRIIAVATDGRRLAKCEAGAKAVNAKPNTAIVPASALPIIRRLLGDGTVRIVVGGSNIHFATASGSVSARLVEGRYPKWRDVIPKQSDETFTIAPDAFAELVRQAAICCSGDSRGIDLTLADGDLTARASTAEVGKSDASIPVPSEFAMSTRLDARFVLQALETAPANTAVRVSFDPEHPARFDFSDQQVAIVMPLSKDH